MVAGVWRGSGVKPFAPTIGELHVRQIFFIVALELFDVLSGLSVDELGQRPLSDALPIGAGGEGSFRSDRSIDVSHCQRCIRGAGLEIHDMTWVKLLTQRLARHAGSKVCRWAVQSS